MKKIMPQATLTAKENTKPVITKWNEAVVTVNNMDFRIEAVWIGEVYEIRIHNETCGDTECYGISVSARAGLNQAIDYLTNAE